MIIVNDLSDKISNFYFLVNKKVNHLIEKTIDQNLDKEKKGFYRMYQRDPNDSEVLEIKRTIIMRKGISLFAIVFLILMGLISIVS
ncbi:hypothetical protein BKK39_12730 [Bacillus cereus]|nr:hypothetical protein [Bacillus cytotoxicus]ONG97482.1 hypothetical protein BKK39_12730 [Bacillus cereus]HDR7741085.1 hypothetical protein [Bacillus pacificus]SME29939.1 hypothetical protein BACERE00183_02804 [Bacillus cereus]HDR7214363.1 hypothetical protein [Bacillus cytotoxicus]